MISIRSGDVTVQVDADHGGRLAAIDIAGQPVLIGPARDRGPMQWGSFPMVPWAGRVRHGRFEFAGQRHELPLDMPPHAIHGTAYRQRWDVGAVSDDEMSMTCDLAWEFGGRAWQRVAVGDSRVTCELGVTAGKCGDARRDRLAPVVREARIVVVPADVDVRPRRRGDPEWRAGATTPGPWDDCFVNTEPVELRYAALTVTVTSDCDHWVVYDEPADATCVEPQSGPPDAFNLRQRVLEPGEQLVRTMTIRSGTMGGTIDWRRTIG